MKRREIPLGEGAAEFAPTAPHATPARTRAAARRTRVGRIWASLRVVMACALLLSLGLHGFVAVRAYGDGPDIELKEVDDELNIPVDMFEEGQPPAPVAPTPPPAPPGTPGQDGPGLIDAGAKPVHDAGAPSPADAGADADAAPPLKPVRDAGTAEPLASGGDGGAEDAGAGDAGAGPGSGPRDPASMVSMSGLVQTGPNNVTLLVNMAAIRKHPVGARMGPLIARIPQWESFIRGNETLIDPVRDTDWILVYGPSLMKTEKVAVLVSYSISNAVVDKALTVMAANYENGGRYETGVPGVKGWLAHADNAERVFLHGREKVVAIVPPDFAKKQARVLAKPTRSRVDPSEAMRLVVQKPHRQISIRGLKFPTELEELRLWIVPTADGGATIRAEGTVVPDSACAEVAATMNEVLRGLASGFAVQVATGGMLKRANVSCDDGVPKAQIQASQAQLEQLFTAISLVLPRGGP